jgi:hypothetical protein
MKIRKIIYGITLCVITIASIYELKYSDYNREQKYILTIIDKVETPEGYKRSPKYYLVLKTSEGEIFSQGFSIASYSQLAVGDSIEMPLSRFNIKQTGLDNSLSFLAIVGLGLDLTGLLVSIVYLLIKLDNFLQTYD